MIKERDIEFDENGKLLMRQKSCMSCTKREVCETLKNHIQNIYFENDIEKMMVLLKRICDDYQPIYIEYPIEVSAIESENANLFFDKGKMVLANVYKEGYDDKLHLALYMGELPNTIVTTYNKETKVVTNSLLTIPIIYVFALNEIVLGTQAKWQDLYDAGIDILTDDEKDILQSYEKLKNQD